jgi:hypothetical protein
MTNNNPNNFQLPSAEPSEKTPQQKVSEIVAYIKAGITLTFYLILVTIICGLGYVVLRITLWAAGTVLRAIGL